MEDSFEGLCNRIGSLQELNDNQQIESLENLKQSLDAEFAEAARLADSLDNQVTGFEEQKAGVEVRMGCRGCRCLKEYS